MYLDKLNDFPQRKVTNLQFLCRREILTYSVVSNVVFYLEKYLLFPSDLFFYFSTLVDYENFDYMRIRRVTS